MSTPERDTRYAEQASVLYGDLKAMIERQELAEMVGNHEQASEIEQDTRVYLARRLYDMAEGGER